MNELLKQLKAQDEALTYFEAQVEAMKLSRRTTLAELEKILPKGAILKTSEGLKRIMGGNGGLVLRKVADAKDAAVVDVTGVL